MSTATTMMTVLKNIVLGLIVGYAALLVHRGRSGDIPWGLFLAWAVVAAAGIHVAARESIAQHRFRQLQARRPEGERGRRSPMAPVAFAICATLFPIALVTLTESARLLALWDWRSITWIMGHILVAIITAGFGGFTRPRRKKMPSQPYHGHSD